MTATGKKADNCTHILVYGIVERPLSLQRPVDILRAAAAVVRGYCTQAEQ